jgi:DDB1- and CUL4-associated factor 8
VLGMWWRRKFWPICKFHFNGWLSLIVAIFFFLFFQFDLRTNESTTLFSIIDSSAYVVELYAIAIDPTNPHLLAVAGSEEFARIYDIRKWGGCDSTPSNSMVGCISPNHLSPSNVDGITGLAYSNTGELLVSYSRNDIYLFSREQVLYYGFDGSNRFEPKVYRGHSNKKTVKGVHFLGPGCEYVASGSDSGHAFIWRKRDGEILRVLQGDRYVVNCIEPHPLVPVLATSGIEKDVKVWTPQSFETEHGKKEVCLLLSFIPL